MHQVGTSSLLIYMMHGHTYIKLFVCYWTVLLDVYRLLTSHWKMGGL